MTWKASLSGNWLPGEPTLWLEDWIVQSYPLTSGEGSQSVSSVAQLCPTLYNLMNRSTPGFPVHHQLPEFTQTHVHQVGDAIQPSHPLLSPSPTPNPSQHQGLFTELTLRMRWPKNWSFSFSISTSNEHPGLISFRMDWLDLLVVQGTLKSSPTPQFKAIISSSLSFLFF